MPAERPPLKRYLLDPLLAIVALVLYGLFRAMRFWAASCLGGLIGRLIGPRLAVSRRAYQNLSLAFPEKSAAEIKSIVRGMWSNLGRMAGEYPHLSKLKVYNPGGYVQVEGADILDAIDEGDKPAIFFSAHLANWEIAPLSATQRGLVLDQVYREANNPMMQWLYEHRAGNLSGNLIPKGAQGAKMLMKALMEGRHVGMLVDQKMNDGIPVEFFGHEAMTAPALAELALRYECPVVPVRVERLRGPAFRVIISPPLEFEPTGDRHADVARMMKLVNQQLEEWIRATPEQWLWLHNRWPAASGTDGGA